MREMSRVSEPAEPARPRAFSACVSRTCPRPIITSTSRQPTTSAATASPATNHTTRPATGGLLCTHSQQQRDITSPKYFDALLVQTNTRYKSLMYTRRMNLKFLIFVLTSTQEFARSFAVGSRSASPLQTAVFANGRRNKRRLHASSSAAAAVSHDDDDGDDTTPVGIGIGSSSSSIRGGASGSNADIPSMWPRMDTLDKRLIRISLPVIANFAINPLIGAVDLFWVNRMANPLAVAGQAAANQVFNSAFWITSFLPSVTATLISKENASGNKEGVRNAVNQALFVGMLISLVSSVLMFLNPDKVLSSVLAPDAPALQFAKPYLLIRSFAFLPSLISLVGFSAFRGILETDTPVKISAFANIFNAVLDPILIFTLAMGVPGAALATLAAEIISAVTYLVLLRKKAMINFRGIFRLPKWKELSPLLKGGAALQLRNLAMNLTFLAVARATQKLDQTGVSAAAHAMSIQTFQIGGIVLLALSTVAQTVVPNDLVERYDEEQKRTVGGKLVAKGTVNRLMSWGFILGIGLGTLQLLVLPLLLKSTPMKEVQEAARLPSILASVYQIMNGLVFIGEGVMVGCGNFLQLSISTIIATVATLWALNAWPPIFGLTGVWMSFGVFNSLRLLGVWYHQFYHGPLANRNLKKDEVE